MRQIIRMKNKISGLLMEEGIEYEGRKLHTKRYFFNLLEQIEIFDELLQILKMSRECLEFLRAANNTGVRFPRNVINTFKLF